MGLLDQVLGGALGSRAGAQQGGNAGMSPLMTALIGLLASQAMGQGRGGGLGGLLGGLTGGAGGMNPGMGGVGGTGGMGGGLGGLLNSFQRSGHGDVMESWIGSGPNRGISPHQLGEALGPDSVETLSQQSGMERGDLLAELSKLMPGVVDQMTPHGRMPNDDEMAKW